MYSDDVFSSFSLTPEDIVDFGKQGIRSTDELPECEHAEDAVVLKLNGNQLSTIKRDSLSNMKSLKFLDISDNELTHIGEIGKLQSLVLLDLSKNRISQLDKLEKLRNLKRLLLARNQIQTVVLNSPLSSLVLLDLRRNPLTALDFGDMFPSVSELYIDKCIFSSLAGIEKFSSLLHLTASENKISDDGVISHAFVQNIDVSFNRLTTISSFYGMKALSYLDVSSNLINDDGITMPGPMPTLRAFKARGTRLTKVSVLLGLFPNIEAVDLANTDIESLDDVIKFVTNSPMLRFLDLRGTPLTKEIYPPPKPRDETVFPSIMEFDDQFPAQSEARRNYRQIVINASHGNLEILDHVKIVGEEMKPSPMCSAPASSSQGEYSDEVHYEEEEVIEMADVETEAIPVTEVQGVQTETAEVTMQSVQVDIGMEAEAKKEEEIRVLKQSVTEQSGKIQELQKELTPFKESLDNRTDTEVQNNIGKPNCRLNFLDAIEVSPPRIICLRGSGRTDVFEQKPIVRAMKTDYFSCFSVEEKVEEPVEVKTFADLETQTAKVNVEIGPVEEFARVIQIHLETSNDEAFEVSERLISICETQTDAARLSLAQGESFGVDGVGKKACDTQTESVKLTLDSSSFGVEAVERKAIDAQTESVKLKVDNSSFAVEAAEKKAMDVQTDSVKLTLAKSAFGVEAAEKKPIDVQTECVKLTLDKSSFGVEAAQKKVIEVQTESMRRLVLKTEKGCEIPLPKKEAVMIGRDAHIYETMPSAVSEHEVQTESVRRRRAIDSLGRLFELPQEDPEKLKRRKQQEQMVFGSSSTQTEVSGGNLDVGESAKFYDTKTLKHIVDKKVKEKVKRHHHKEMPPPQPQPQPQPIVIQAPAPPQFPYEQHFSSLEKQNRKVIEELQALRSSLKTDQSQSAQSTQIDRLFVLVDSILNDNRALRRDLESARSAMSSAQLEHLRESMTLQSALNTPEKSSRKRRDSFSSEHSKSRKSRSKSHRKPAQPPTPPESEGEYSTEAFDSDSIPKRGDMATTATNATPQRIAYPTHLNPHSTPVLTPMASRSSMTDISMSQSPKDRMNFGECEKSILVSARIPTNIALELQPGEPDFKIIHFWLSVSMRQSLDVQSIVKLPNTKAFLRLQKKSAKLYLVMFPTDHANERTRLPSPITVFRYLSRMSKPVPHSFLLCAANLGSQSVDNQSNKEPTATTERRLMEQGFDSLIYTHNGVEAIRILDAKNVVPVFAVEL